MKLKVKKLTDSSFIKMPFYSTKQSAGMDLQADLDKNLVLKPNEFKLIPTGIAIALEENFEAQIRPRSGLAAKHGITVLNTPGTIDADYRGEVKIILINLSTQDFIIEPGMRIAQMVINKYESVEVCQVEDLDETERGEGGFGSTGTKATIDA